MPQKVHGQGTYLYVTNQLDNSVSVIEPTSGNTVATIPVGDTPQAIVYNGNYVYVAQVYYGTGGGVTVIDPRTNSVITTISTATFGISHLALNPNGTRLYASDQQSRVYVIDTTSNTVVNTLTGFTAAQGIAVDPSDTHVYIVNGSSPGWVSVLNTSNYSTVATIPVGNNPLSIAVTPDGSKAYTGNYASNNVSVINTSTFQVVNTIPEGQNVTDIRVNPSGTYAYVMNQNWFNGPGNISVINTSSDAVAATVTVGFQPISISFSSDGNTVYVTNSHDDNISVIDASTNIVFNTINTGNYPFAATIVNIPIPTPTPTPTNAPPQVGSITVSPNPVQVNTAVIASASFTDANTLDTHTVTVNWGDGSNPTSCTISESSGSGIATCTRSSGYTMASVYSPIITATDNYGASGDSPSYEYLSVYNPTSQGLFSGARIFNSPFGAYTAQPSFIGQVQFGITAKYNNNNQPTGKVSMNFKQANLEFESTSITVLVTLNGKAILRGIGTINGTGNYTFLATGIDGINDTIRFQIKNESTVVYDSQLNDLDTADPTALVTGQVSIH